MEKNSRGGLLAGLAVAGLLVGLVDVGIAIWSNRHLPPSRVLPLCLSAPLPMAIVVLVPLLPLLAWARRLGAARDGSDDRFVAARTVATLLGFATAVAGWRVLLALGDTWQRSGYERAAVVLPWVAWLPALALGVASAFVLAKVASPIRPGGWRWVARVAWSAQAMACVCLAWLVLQEGRGVLRAAVFSGAFDGTSSGRSPLEARSRPRHLLLITIDTLRADRLEDAWMPRAWKLAAEGTRFTAAFSSAPWTLPSLASIHTGRPAHEHGAGRSIGETPLARGPLAGTIPVLAEVLRKRDFSTRAIVTNPYLALDYGLGRGFQTYENLSLETEALRTLESTLAGWILSRFLPTAGLRDLGSVVTDRAGTFLRGAGHRRFFLWLHYVDPHAPYSGPDRSFRGDLLAAREHTSAGLPSMARLRAGEIRPTAAGRRRLRQAYDGAVRSADKEIGRVADLLARFGLAGETLVVITSDHGEEFWEHGDVEHGHSLYDEVVRVPMILRGPGVAPSGVVDETVATDGLAATILTLMGVEVPAGMKSGFATAVRTGRLAKDEVRPAVSSNLLFAEERSSLRTDRYTFIRWPSGKEEVYDRVVDPLELLDLAGDEALRSSLRASFLRHTARRPMVPEVSAPTRPSVREALRSLGYVR